MPEHLTPTPQELHARAALLKRRRPSEHYSFRVADKEYSIQYLRTSYLEGYDDAQLARLAACKAFEVSYRLEDYTMPDGSILSGYGAMDTGHAFQILGGVANGILGWTQKNQPDYLYWFAQGTRRQRLYDRIIGYFAARGSGWHRLRVDPFIGVSCAPETFWLARSLPPTPVPHERP